jgi:hypothetical protein
MFTVTHISSGSFWAFTCSGVPSIQGGGRARLESIDAAEHAVRQYLERRGEAASLKRARRLTRHRCEPGR